MRQTKSRFLSKAARRAHIDSFCGVFQSKPGEPSVVAEHLAERQAEREVELTQLISRIGKF